MWSRSRTKMKPALAYNRSLGWALWWLRPSSRPSATELPFTRDREFAAWLGLVPRQWSTGGKAKLLGISKRGNPYLRKMFIHGARAAVLRVKRQGSCLGQWMSGLETRAARNVVIVATANKLARISWAVLSSGEDYHPMHRAVSSAS